MATSISSQLQAIKSFIQVDSDPQKRPFTRLSILFEPKEAADIDIETILGIALSGLEILIGVDQRFRNYKNDLFSNKSKDLDRELMGIEDNNRINASINSYLRLLSGHLQLHAALKTLEYLIRRYRVHVYNMGDLILCALPFHDTHAFVRIMQIINTGNTKWKFLDAVRVSGAPPPRTVIVQQCIRDKGVLEALCNYATPTKKSQPSRPIISFCTAVVVEALGSVTSVDNDTVKRVLPFVVSALQPGSRGGTDHKAGALMIVGLLANKVSLSPKLVKSLIRSIAEIIREDAKESTGLQWFRLSLMALINLVQLQSVDMLPKKALEILKKIRDIAGALSGLSKEFNIDKFLVVLLESLVDYSSSDPSCHLALISILETVPLKNLVYQVVSKVLLSCVKLSLKKSDLTSSESGSWAKEILVIINKNYPSELRGVVHKFLEVEKKEDALYEILWKMLDGNSDMSAATPDSKIWFALYHPKADVRRATLSGLNASGILKSKAVDSQRLVSIQDAILRQLRDDDLTVIQATLSLDGMPEILNSSDLLEALSDVFKRCLGILMLGSSEKSTVASDVAIASLKIAIAAFHDQVEYSEKLSAMIFPLLLILPETKRLNLKVLDLVKEVKFPFYENLAGFSVEIKKDEERVELNMKIVNGLAETFLMHPEEYMPWLIKSCIDFKLSKTLFFLVLMRSFQMQIEKHGQFSALYEACFPILKTEWEGCEGFLKHIPNSNTKEPILAISDLRALNANILICTFLRRLQDLFIFFATSQFKHCFKEHLHYLVTKCKLSPVQFLSRLFTEEDVPVEVQVESLRCFAFLCLKSDDGLQFQLLAEFPSLLVPLASDNQDMRITAMGCIESLCTVWSRVDLSSKKNGNAEIWSNFLDEPLGLLVQQKKLILSDRKFLSSFLTSLLGSSCRSLLVPQSIEQRFNQLTKGKILAFILGAALKLSEFGKLMILSLLKELGHAVMLVKDVQSLLSSLLQRRRQCYFELNMSSKKLSTTEVKILCILLEICAMPSSLGEGHAFEDYLLSALQLDCASAEDPAIIEPCLTVLQKLSGQSYSGLTSEIQGLLFRKLVTSYRNANGDIQNATRDALLRLNITCYSVIQMLDFIFKQGSHIVGSAYGNKKTKITEHLKSDLQHDVLCKGETALSFLSSLLDILLLKKDIANRDSLIGPLFKLLGAIFSDEWVHGTFGKDELWIQASSGISQTASSTLCYIQQTLLLILEDICASLKNDLPIKDDIMNNINIRMLIECAHSTRDGVTRNHVFSLLSTIAKVIPDKTLEHIGDILTIIGESTVTQIDSHSQHVFEDLISTVVPCWLSKADNTEKLLQVIFDAFLQFRCQLADFVFRFNKFVLTRCLALNQMLIMLICASFYSSIDIHNMYLRILYPQLFPVGCLRQITQKNCFRKLLLVMELISPKVQDPEFAFKLESSEDSDNIQRTLEELMGQVVSLLQLVDPRRKQISVAGIIRKKLKECMHAVLRTITTVMIPSAYFKGITNLLGHADGNVRKKALRLLCETVKDRGSIKSKRKGRRELNPNINSHELSMDDNALDSFLKMCMQIVQLVDDSLKESSTSLNLVAISTLEVLANNYPSNYSIFSLCLAPVTKSISSHDLAVSSSSLRTVGAIINVLGPRALPELPCIMKNTITKADEVPSDLDAPSSSKESLLVSILVTLEAVLEKLGGFLSPYLGEILRLMVLRPEYVSGAYLKLKLKADVVRRLISDKVPVRLAFPPLLKIYPSAVDSGDSSLGIFFEMLANLVCAMDRLSVGGYYANIFDLCLGALDLRRQHPVSVHNIDAVEKSIIIAMVTLTMKLTETMFKPLFIRSIEWAESDVEEVASGGRLSIDRAVSFYSLVNKLAENHRSLFVPYFKYVLEGCVRHLTDEGDATAGLIRKKKKAKTRDASNSTSEGNNVLSLRNWHLRALVLSSLHKCFLYDTGTLTFLNSSNFQVLLKPIVSQLVVEPPTSLEEHANIPSVNEVDDLLVVCIGQMAVTAGTDLLWKPLNHEVLMQTRSDKVRSRLLGLRIVKYLLDNLKEEYMVFLPETIPFLGELLEDVELPVKSLAQDILKEMESMSGESLRQYL
ncbi:LOW QUALITY PROTEIN: BP28CT domain-containing protein/U3snoRNP10 domain-containing protein [Cephalotus follicularis]|uniref:BP28CT domain-containing protein/U3snoRNP10 domain-containing protein n=1 Tax=Cephalotus follicularis TaxID=3775 RepID=A0A1Q3CH85_CEPFO|nr:LOW QUALITY PROTEIN: BP28CT domain-containing protein/U3snoRNP10 domain-containing protein [Cephalotus follicularis]